MAKGLTESVQIVGYVPHALKARMERITAHMRRMPMSRIIEDALVAYIPTLEGDRTRNPSKPHRLAHK